MKWTIIIFLLFFGIGASVGQKVSAGSMLQNAIGLLDRNQEDDALQLLNAYLIQQPNDEVALFLRAGILSNKANYLSALTDYNTVIALDEENKEAHYNRGFVKYQLGQYQSAILDFELCMQLPQVETNTAYFKIDPGTKTATGISTISSMNIDAWNYIGLCHYHLSAFESAIKAFDRGLQLDHGNTDILINRGRTFEKMDNHDMAKADYQMVLKANPEHELALLNLQRLSAAETELPDLDAFITKFPQQAMGYANRGLVHFQLEDFQAAEEDFSKSLELQPKNNEYAFGLALAKIRLDKLDEAEMLLIDLSSREPQNAAVFFNLGNIKYKHSMFQEAISYYTISIAIDDSNASFLHNRALAFYENNQIEEACHDISQAQAIEPEIGLSFKSRHCKVDAQ
jgi:tetratricopeptide (TPR) repeat protein